MFEEVDIEAPSPISLPATAEPAKAHCSSCISIVSSSSSSSSSSEAEAEAEDKEDDATPVVSNKRRVTFSKLPPTIITMASPAYIQVSDRVTEIVERFSRTRGISSGLIPTLIDYGELLVNGQFHEESFIDRVSSIIDLARKVVPMPKDQVPALALRTAENSPRDEATDLYLQLRALIYGENGSSSGDTQKTEEGSLTGSPQHSVASETLVRVVTEDDDSSDNAFLIVETPQQRSNIGTKSTNIPEKDGENVCQVVIQDSSQCITSGAEGALDGEAETAVVVSFFGNTTIAPVAADGDDGGVIRTTPLGAVNNDGDDDAVEYSPRVEGSCCIIS